jgi:hypothetical protein
MAKRRALIAETLVDAVFGTFSDAGAIPASSTTRPREIAAFFFCQIQIRIHSLSHLQQHTEAAMKKSSI